MRDQTPNAAGTRLGDVQIPKAAGTLAQLGLLFYLIGTLIGLIPVAILCWAAVRIFVFS